jgi:transposase
VIALIVTPDGFPLAYEVLPGNTADCTTLRGALRQIETQYGKAQRIWVMLCGAISYVQSVARGTGIYGSPWLKNAT